MAYTLTNPPSEKCELTPKNRVWGFFENSNRTRPANRRKPQELRQKIRLTPTKTASGIPYWPSRDPIGEMGHETAKAHMGDDSFYEDLYDDEGADSDNEYAFVLNSPTYGIDVNGEWSWLRPLARPVVQGLVNVVARVAARRAAREAARRAAAQAAHLAKRRVKRIAECEAIHQGYERVKAAGCNKCTTKAEAETAAALLTTQIAGRTAYLAKKCDYFLPGSIARGSAVAERGHQIQLAQKTAELAKCAAKIKGLP